MLGGDPGDSQVFKLLIARFELGRKSQLIRLPTHQVTLLQQQATDHAANIILGGVHPASIDRSGFQQPHALAPGLQRANHFDRIIVKRRSGNDFGKEPRRTIGLTETGIRFHDNSRQFFIDIAIESHDSAECADHIAQIGFLIRLSDIRIYRTPARIHMLNNHRRRLIKFLNQFKCRIGIHQVIEADRGAAVQQFGIADADFLTVS